MEEVLFPYTDFRMSYTFWLVLITHNVAYKNSAVLLARIFRRKIGSWQNGTDF